MLAGVKMQLLKKEAIFEIVGYVRANEYAGFQNPPLKPACLLA
jgi:hypothetical protein